MTVAFEIPTWLCWALKIAGGVLGLVLVLVIIGLAALGAVFLSIVWRWGR